MDYAAGWAYPQVVGDSLKIPLVLVPMLRVGMQGAALRADIPKAKFVRQISVPQLMGTPAGFDIAGRT
ncbi:MAG: hypothetical protein GY749_41730, partial [Desulfobacteraceae bacterium]|nr:hypothetical protein [Desulfobacteraceae bacterium]